jgi:hypothetical protein
MSLIEISLGKGQRKLSRITRDVLNSFDWDKSNPYTKMQGSLFK